MQTLLLAASERNALGHRTSLLDLPKLGRHSSCPSGPGVQRDTNFHSRRRTHAPHNSAQNRAQNDVFEPRRAQRSRLAGAVHPSSVGQTERPVGRFGSNPTAPQLTARSLRSIDGAAATRSPRDGRVGVGRGWRRSPVRRVSPTVSLRVLCAATRTIWAPDLCARSGAQSHQQQRRGSADLARPGVARSARRGEGVRPSRDARPGASGHVRYAQPICGSARGQRSKVPSECRM
jgi:hypothetical protein